MPNTKWEIIDKNGTIHSGKEYEMKKAFDFMTETEAFLIDNYGMTKKAVNQLISQWQTDWNGDLKLIQIHQIKN